MIQVTEIPSSPAIQVVENGPKAFWASLNDTGSYQARQSPNRREIVRKLRGIVLVFEGPETRVLLASEGEKFEYYLDSKFLEESGVKNINQPFEYIEGKETFPSGRVEWFTGIEAAAPASSARIEPLPLDSEYQKKRQEILQYFGQK